MPFELPEYERAVGLLETFSAREYRRCVLALQRQIAAASGIPDGYLGVEAFPFPEGVLERQSWSSR
jgi:hypothetical protein